MLLTELYCAQAMLHNLYSLRGESCYCQSLLALLLLLLLLSAVSASVRLLYLVFTLLFHLSNR
jgi:hypothetical protein